MKKLAPIVALVVAALVVSGAAAGATHATSKTKKTFTAVLTIGQERPAPKGTKAGAAGKFTATVSGTTLTWKLTFSHLSGPATAAHVHAGKKGVPGAVLIPLCGPCSASATGTAHVTSDQADQMERGLTYVNVHTTKNAGGEIRGQIKELT